MQNEIILITERLIIREANLSDSKFIFDLLNTPKWIKYIGDRGIKTLKNAEDYINDKIINSYKTNGYGLYIFELKESHIPIGLCGFIKRDYLDSEDIGFALLPDYERKGYTFEAAAAVLKYGESQFGLTKVCAITSKGNIALFACPAAAVSLAKFVGLAKASPVKSKLYLSVMEISSE